MNHTESDPPTPEVLRNRLKMIFRWYRGMIDGETGRLVYVYDPEAETAITDKSPIRDIASIWDIEILSDFLGSRDLLPFINKRLEYYGGSITNLHGLALLDEALLAEPSDIAHSAFMVGTTYLECSWRIMDLLWEFWGESCT